MKQHPAPKTGRETSPTRHWLSKWRHRQRTDTRWTRRARYSSEPWPWQCYWQAIRILRLKEICPLFLFFYDASWDVWWASRHAVYAWCLTASFLVLTWPPHLRWSSPRGSCRSCVGALSVRLAHFAVSCRCNRSGGGFVGFCCCVWARGGRAQELLVEARVRGGMLELKWKSMSNERRASNAARNERQTEQE